MVAMDRFCRGRGCYNVVEHVNGYLATSIFFCARVVYIKKLHNVVAILTKKNYFVEEKYETKQYMGLRTIIRIFCIGR